MVAWIFLGFCFDVSMCVTQVLREKERKKRPLEKPRKAKVSVRKKIMKKG